MPPKKRARRSTVNDQDEPAPCRQSSRSNRGVGGHAAQLQKAGEAIAAPARNRKGQNDYPELDASDPEENSMAPAQLRQGKKGASAKPPAAKNATKQKPASTTPPTTSKNLKRSSQKSGDNVRHHSAYTSPRPVLRTGCSSDRFGFKAPASTTSVHRIERASQSSNRRMAAQEANERDDDDNRESARHSHERADLEEHNDTQVLILFRLDGAEQDQHLNDSENSGQRLGAPSEDGGDDEGDLDGGDLDGGGGVDSDGGDLGQERDWEDEPMNVEGQDNETYDVLERHQAQNGQRKAPSPSYLSKVTHSKSPHQRPSRRNDRSKSPRQRLSQCNGRSGSRQHAPSGGASSVQAPPSRRRRSLPHSHKSSTRSRSPRQRSYRQVTSTQSSLHTKSQRRRSPSRPLTSSGSRALPSSHRHSPLRTRSDHATTPSRSCSRSPTPAGARRTRNVKTNQENPSKLGFYPACWQGLPQAAKLQMRLQAILTHPIPKHQDAVQLAQEVLDAELWLCHQKKLKFENGYFPEYSPQMCRLLCDDLFTFRTELKKVVISITKSSYDIFPKGTAMLPEQIKKHIVTAATALLKTGDYLRIPDSSNGKFKNFVSQALKDVCLEFFYSNSKKALKNTDDFRQTIPINALILVAAVMKGVISGFSDTGSDKVPELSADRCRTDFDKLQKSVNTLLDIPERREELEEMLEQWAKIGMGEFDWHADGSGAGSDAGDINIIL
ncbi:hypothetical protein DEU56DRAFT_762107 [Suillus clintonianus]|uniref:uncharacterized protein n=1 Tax=Suillus clintonianus TaxID=1904413 RepID=UPI001B861118|nr:uncharacterized protein DEU56DRAFT_762107 [Suillus clintonianus]KAG2111823.1 hypothetical protein DEU56DRAFT_762107 [Suillus clintonianus]